MTTRRDQDIALLEADRLLRQSEGRQLTPEEQTEFDALISRAKEAPSMDDAVLEQPTNPTRAIGGPAVRTRQRTTGAALLRGAVALACGERGVDTGLAAEVDRETRLRAPYRKFEGAVAVPAKLLLVEKAVSALTGQNAADTTGDQWLDSLFFRVDEAIPGPRLSAALGVNVLAATEERVHITKLTGRIQPGWIARDGDVADSDATFDAVEVEPKTVGANVLIKRSALLYGTHPQVEPLLAADLREAVLDELDRATLFGDGLSNSPTGIASVASAGHALGSLADAYKVRNQLLSYQKSDAGMRWLLPDLAEGKLATTAAFSGATTPTVMGGLLAGYPYVLRPLWGGGSPTQSQQTYLSGNFNFAHLVIWDSVSILANPFGAGYKSGSVELRVLCDANVLVRDPKRMFVGDAAILAV